jgi:hypothetical protein
VDAIGEDLEGASIELAPDAWEAIVAPHRATASLRVRRLY